MQNNNKVVELGLGPGFLPESHQKKPLIIGSWGRDRFASGNVENKAKYSQSTLSQWSRGEFERLRSLLYDIQKQGKGGYFWVLSNNATDLLYLCEFCYSVQFKNYWDAQEDVNEGTLCVFDDAMENVPDFTRWDKIILLGFKEKWRDTAATARLHSSHTENPLKHEQPRMFLFERKPQNQ